MARRLAAWVAVLAMALALLSLTPASGWAAGGSLRVAPSPEYSGKQVRIAGRLSTQVARPVRLQKKRRGRWVTVKKATSEASGRFTVKRRFWGPDGARIKVRVAAPRTRIGYREYRKLVTRTRAVRIKRQAASLSVPATPYENSGFTVRGSFKPVRRGRPVVLQQRRPSGGWAIVGRGTQTRQGKANVRLDAVAVGSFPFRMRAERWRGLAPRTTGARTVRVQPDPDSDSPIGVTMLETGGDAYGFYPDISDDGRYVPYTSWVSWDGGWTIDANVFLRDRDTDQTTPVTTDIGKNAQITRDGRFIAHTGSGLSRDNIFVFDVAEDARIPVHRHVGWSDNPAISDNGRFVAFESDPAGPNEQGGPGNVMVHDLEAGNNTQITDGDAWSRNPAISSDGQYVTFHSQASNLVEDDTNNRNDVFVHDRSTATTTRITDGDRHSSSGEISGDGRFITFSSTATNLVPGDTNNRRDIFVYDLATETTTRITDGNRDSGAATITADGRYIAFHSSATDVVPRDINREMDVFLHDRDTAATTRITDGNLPSSMAEISGNGRFIAFQSDATNLVPGGTGNEDTDVFVHERVPRSEARGTTSP